MAELADINLVELMEEERKAEEIVAEAKKRAEEIIKEAEAEARALIAEAEKSDIDVRYRALEESKLDKEIASMEREFQDEIKRLRRRAEEKLEEAIKYLFEVIIYGGDGS
ncbi:MAG: hypothetical protein J7L11_01545 [Thermoprotei archaeon]|nr:hypothetical protein [Thermoprotei archaeon]